jgi:hypothetical protein
MFYMAERTLSRRAFLEAAAAFGASLALPRAKAFGAGDFADVRQEYKYTSWDSILDPKELSIRVSKKVLDEFKRVYNHEREDAYILLADMRTGVVTKAVKDFWFSSDGHCGFEEGFYPYLDNIARKHGYMVVGHYHSHPDARGVNRAGDMLTGDDVYPIIPNEVIRLLGNGSEDHGVQFSTRVYVPLYPRCVGENHPLLARKDEFIQTGRVAKSRYDGWVNENHLELGIAAVDVQGDIGVADLLMQHPVFMTKYASKADSTLAGELILALSTGKQTKDDNFDFKDPRTDSQIEVKLRHDGALTITLQMQQPNPQRRELSPDEKKREFERATPEIRQLMGDDEIIRIIEKQSTERLNLPKTIYRGAILKFADGRWDVEPINDSARMTEDKSFRSNLKVLLKSLLKGAPPEMAAALDLAL